MKSHSDTLHKYIYKEPTMQPVYKIYHIIIAIKKMIPSNNMCRLFFFEMISRESLYFMQQAKEFVTLQIQRNSKSLHNFIAQIAEIGLLNSAGSRDGFLICILKKVQY